MRSQGLDVQIEPASKAPKPHVIPLEALFKMLEGLEKKRLRLICFTYSPTLLPVLSVSRFRPLGQDEAF
jgi:hypothetical protein